MNTQLATDNQITYIYDLIKHGPTSGNPAPEGPTTVEGIEALTKAEASAYIDALKASQGPNIENLKRQAAEAAQGAEARKEDSAAAVAAIKSGERTSLRDLKAARAAR